MPLAKDDKQHTYTADPLIAAIVMRALETHPRSHEMAHRQPGQDDQAATAESADGKSDRALVDQGTEQAGASSPQRCRH
jgi:hypothetical protein